MFPRPGHYRTAARRKRGGVLTLELVLTLPVLLIVLFALVEYAILLVANQAVTAAAAVGARAATLPNATHASVVDSVQQALSTWQFGTEINPVEIEINNTSDSVVPLSDAQTGDAVRVTVTLDSIHAAPNLLSFVGMSLNGQQLSASYVLRKE